MQLLKIVQNKCLKLRLQPIRVFCLHHVCERFDPESMNECDWMPIDEFKSKVLALQQSGVRFISLTEAHHRLRIALSPFAFRLKHYAVITFDDGYASLKEILPWLKEQNIPATLFINPDYAAGKAYRKTPKEQYLSIEELQSICGCPMGETNGRGWVEIGMHGLQHIDVSAMSELEFREFVNQNIESQSSIINHQSSINFWAYTWGRHNTDTDNTLKKLNIVPVLMDGVKNYNDATCIHRELLK